MIERETIPASFWKRPQTVRAFWSVGCLLLGTYIWFIGIPCVLFELTGIYCPGCGATRAVKALAHGDVVTALHDNAWLIFFAAPSLILTALCNLRDFGEKGRLWTRQLLVVTAYAAIVFAVLRNIHVWPFTWLAPIGS